MRRSTVQCLLAFAIVASISGLASAADPAPLSRADLDKRASMAAFEAVHQGVELFNAGKHDECLRVYEGAITILRPLFDHRPDLTKLIADRIEKAKALKTAPDKAYALREALDEVIKLGPIVGSTKGDIVEVKKKPLWDRLGGETAVRGVVAEFLTTAAKDPKANIDRDKNYPLTKERTERVLQLVVEFISSATGGPLKYTGRDMKNTHQGMKITDSEFNAAAGHLIAALQKFKVPQAEIDELVAIVGTTAKDMIEVKK